MGLQNLQERVGIPGWRLPGRAAPPERERRSEPRSRPDRVPPEPGLSALASDPAHGMLRRMFARYFVELPIPPEDGERALSRDPRSWLPGLAEGRTSTGRPSPRGGGVRREPSGSRRTVIVELGKPITPRPRASSRCGGRPRVMPASSPLSMPTSRSRLSARTHPARDERAVRSSLRRGRPCDRSSAPLEGRRSDTEGLPRSGRRHHRERAGCAGLARAGSTGSRPHDRAG